MIDARIQLKELLEAEGLQVKPRYPKEITTVPLVTFFELTNTSTEIKVRDSISFQFDMWADTFEEVIDLTHTVDLVMRNLGLKRDYVSADNDSVDTSGYYRKTARYSRYVDTRTNRLIN